ncbi:ABC transporter permease [Chelativorans alearense]|uniref:ABC transporter permease n=1 Tax=Chelativorans alearense TaxID=2681495 RepID=UPI001FEA8311|nr:ABC transporter permease [Chelativorans alearense]
MIRFTQIASFALSLLVALALIGLWHFVASARLVPPIFLPLPEKTFDALVTGMQNGVLLDASLATLRRMFFGWFLACLAGISLGALVGSSQKLRIYVAPMLETLRPLPASSLIPLFIAVIGLSEGMILGVIAFGALWPLLLATTHGIVSVEPLLIEVAQALAMPKHKVLWKISLPSAMPDILAAMRLSLTVSLILAVVCEMLTGSEGLGQWLLATSRAFASTKMFAGIVVLGLMGYASSLIMNLVEARALKWKSAAN